MTRILGRLRQLVALRRSDILGREQGQAMVRVAVSSAVIGYLIAHHAPFDFSRGVPAWLVFVSVFLVLSLLVAVAAHRDRRSPLYRRVAANVADITAISYLMSSTGEVGAPLFVLYLWVTLGNGFRFGLAAMGISTLLSLAGFGIVALTTPLWKEHVMLAAGVLVALLVLPGYAAHLIRQLHRARERAEEASSAKSQFLARMSHDLRTPLNGILGTTELLRNSQRLTSEERGLLGVIQDSVAVSLRQINNVLDYSRIEAGKLVLEQSEFDLHRLLQDTMRMVGLAAGDRKLRLLVRIHPQAPFQLVGDPHHLREILLNLLSNAVKFTPSGYVALQVELASAEAGGVRLRFEVRDTGIGIAPEALERIWESFTQEETGTAQRYGGTGLGTTIAKQLVELMGGRIAVSSIKGRGTVFWCELPFRQPEVIAPVESLVSGARVLLLSSDANTTERLRTQVEALHGTLVGVASLADAVGALARGIRLGNPWHVVLVDEAHVVLSGERHVGTELVDKALAAQTPLYLVSDRQRDSGQLCEWGYAGLLAHASTPSHLANAIHASPHNEGGAASSSGVVRVEPWAWGKQGTRRRRVLIADDNRTNLLILQQILEAAGYEVDVVADGELALERIVASPYKAAIIDLHMPGFDGVNLLRRYRLLCSGVRVPIIMLTADSTFDAQSSSAEAGADAFLTKPVMAETLLTTLDRLIQDREVRTLPLTGTDSSVASVAGEEPVLDVTVLAELDRLCRDPARLAAVVSVFESEGENILARLHEAVVAHNHSAFAEWVHAMKGNAANVGAVRLANTCRRLEAAGVLEFRRRGSAQVGELREQFADTCRALHEISLPAATPGRSGPG